VSQQRDMTDIFLSYSREDLSTARLFAAGLEREGFSVWWDQNLDAGEAFDHVTEMALEHARVVVVLWSPHSVQSRWVRAEATQADRLKKLVPVEIEPCKRPILFELTQTASISGWNGDAGDSRWQALVAGLRRQLGKRDAPSLPAPVAAPGASSAWSSRWVRGLVLGIVGLLFAGVVVLMFTRTGKESLFARAENTAPVTLAVLPFVNLSSDPEQEYFSDGLTEEILNHLAQVKALGVTGRTSSFSFKGKNEDLRVIGEKLGVANLLEGSVRKSGNELRITAQLIDARDGSHLWSETYERSLDNVFEIQEAIARDVARALSVKLEVGELAGRPGMTRNIEAYDAYLAAARFTEPTPEHLRAAMPLLERATTLDPAFVMAWAGLVDRYAFAASTRLAGNTVEGWAERSDAVLEHMRGISDFGESMYEWQAGDRSQNQWDMVAARQHFDRARALEHKAGWGLDSDPATGVFLVVTGRFRDAIALLERSRVEDPLNAFVSFLLSRAYAASGNLPAAIAEEDRGLQLEGFQVPLRGSAVLTALATRDRKLIEQRLALTLEGPSGPSEFLAELKARLDNPVDALALVRRRAAASTDHVELSALAVWMASLGDPEGALEHYRRRTELFRSVRRNAVLFDIWNPVMHDMRQLPGFKDLAREFGLVDYWRTYGWADLCKPVGVDDFECT
jgi:TolB-like protein